MTAADLTPEQQARLAAQVRRILRYLNRLNDRMDRRGRAVGDDVRVAARDALNAVHALSVRLHYASCKPGTVGR